MSYTKNYQNWLIVHGVIQKLKGLREAFFETLYIIGTQAEGSELCSELTKTSLCYVVCPGKKTNLRILPNLSLCVTFT